MEKLFPGRALEGLYRGAMNKDRQCCCVSCPCTAKSGSAIYCRDCKNGNHIARNTAVPLS